MQNETQTSNTESEPMKMPENSPIRTDSVTAPTKPLSGGVIGVLVLLLLLILGGLYLWFNQLRQDATTAVATPSIERPTPDENNEPESTTAEAAVATQQALSTSDEITAIEADIEATDLDSLDAELNAIDAELEAVLNQAI